MEYTNTSEVVSKEYLFSIHGVRVEIDVHGNLYFAGQLASIEQLDEVTYCATGMVFRSKKPKKVIGARKRKKALYASLKKFAVKLRFSKG